MLRLTSVLLILTYQAFHTMIVACFSSYCSTLVCLTQLQVHRHSYALHIYPVSSHLRAHGSLWVECWRMLALFCSGLRYYNFFPLWKWYSHPSAYSSLPVSLAQTWKLKSWLLFLFFNQGSHFWGIESTSSLVTLGIVITKGNKRPELWMTFILMQLY